MTYQEAQDCLAKKYRFENAAALRKHWISTNTDLELFFSEVAELFARNVAIDAMEQYSLFLEDQGYLDTDWRAEEPLAIGEFLKSEFNKQDVMH